MSKKITKQFEKAAIAHEETHTCICQYKQPAYEGDSEFHVNVEKDVCPYYQYLIGNDTGFPQEWNNI